MDDFDAKNHIRDMHRDAEMRRLARLAEANAKANQTKQSAVTLIPHRIMTLALTFVR
jgi:hypothetical protein